MVITKRTRDDDDNLNINFIIIMIYDNKIELLRKENNA